MIEGSTFAAMKTARRWLLADPDKVPHYTNGTKRSGKLDAPEDLARLSTYSEVKAALLKCAPGWHLGFALGPDGQAGNWQGIDLDNVGQHELSHFVGSLPGYVETSPSGKGVHAIGYGRNFRPLGSNGSGIEAYSGGRFFTVTENAVRDGAVSCLAECVENSLAPRHKAQASRASQAAKAPSDVQISAQTIADLRSALNHMRSDDYALWIEMGHALKALGDAGRGLWLDWSATSSKFDPKEAAWKWASFDPQHTGHQAVFAKAQAHGWINPANNAAIFAKFADSDPPVDGPTIVATPFVTPVFFEIPPRPWILGRWLLRGTITTVIAPGGTGKSALMVAMALSLATGRQLIGKTVWAHPQRAWLWNLEDDRDELTRQIAACSLHHRINDDEYAGRLFLNDAGSSLCTATKGRDGLAIHEPVNAAVVAEIRARKIDVLIVDPFVSSHRAEENDNGQVDAIAKRWASIARETDCSIILVHHSRKLAGQQVDAEAARGASALGNAARTVLVLNGMEKGEAVRFGIGEEDRRNYFRVNNDKSNRAPAGKSDWYRRISVPLRNGGPEGGDSVVVVEQWTPPEISTIFDCDVRRQIQAEIASGEWRAHSAARDWAGNAIAKVIGADISVSGDKKRAAALLKDMLKKGQLRTKQQPDASRHLRDFIVVGEPVGDSCDSSEW